MAAILDVAERLQLSDALLLAWVAAFTIPHFATASRRSHQPKSVQYEDSDGKSTRESLAAFESRVRAVKIIIVVLAVLGMGIGAVSRVPYLGGHEEPVSRTIAWVLILIQGIIICMLREHGYILGLYSMCSCIGLAAFSIHGIMLTIGSPRGVLTIPQVCQLVCSLSLAAFCAAIPHRPTLYDDQDRWINTQFTGSVLQSMAIAFVDPIIAIAKRKGDLDVADLGRVTYA